MDKKTPKHCGFEAPARGIALPIGTKFEKNPDGTLRIVEINNLECREITKDDEVKEMEKTELEKYSDIKVELLEGLRELTRVEPDTIDFNDYEVMKMFQSNDNSDLPFGSWTVPEFSSDYVQDILKIAKPKNFDDLVTVVGLSHGTDVWTGNAIELIQDGVADISEVIGDREDVRQRMVNAGIDSETAFLISETVRKGQANRDNHHRFSEKWDDLSVLMREHGIPEWYIKSCEKIGFLLPRARAIYYTQSAWRLAWYKLHYPLEFYKVMIDVEYNYADFENMAADIEKYAMHMEELMNEPIDEDLLENQSEFDKRRKIQNQYKACKFFLKFYAEGYKLISKEVSESGSHLCEIDKENNAIIVY